MWERFVSWLARKMFPIEPLNDGGEPLSLENYEAQRRRKKAS
jgi:hypothetical protein